jgi:hypothetical protein
MEGGSRSCSEVVTVKKKSKKFKLKKLLLRGLGTLISGMIFGVGCTIVDRRRRRASFVLITGYRLKIRRRK